MSKTIWKFPFPISDFVREVKIPGFMPCHVAMQDGVPTLWAEVSPGSDTTRDFNFQWFGTGHDIPGSAMYVGTVQDGAFVFHLYEVAP